MLLERITSADVSIGLGLMLEAIFRVDNRYDEKREVPEKVDINKYDYHIYNVLTVLRDARSSITGKYAQSDLFNVVVDDMNVIDAMYHDTDCKVILMFPDYTRIMKEMNKDKEIKTTKKFSDLLELYDLSLKFKKDGFKGLTCSTVDVKSPASFKGRVLLTTSYLIDMQLLGVYDILESHTGRLKNKHKLNTKFMTIGKKDLSHIPYFKSTHWIFGDTTFVSSLPIGQRKEIYDISIEKKWTTQSSEVKIISDIRKIIKIGV